MIWLRFTNTTNSLSNVMVVGKLMIPLTKKVKAKKKGQAASLLVSGLLAMLNSACFGHICTTLCCESGLRCLLRKKKRYEEHSANNSWRVS